MVEQISRPTVYGIGYSGRTLDEIRQLLEQLDAYLVDIRFVPNSRNPAFRQKALINALGDRYIHVQAFGNPNFRSGGPVEIADYDAGKAALEALDKPTLLMCMCKDPATCHRTVVLRHLAEDGFETQEWGERGTDQLPLL